MLLGTDPEFPIVDNNGKAVPAWRFFPDIHNKLRFTLDGDFYGIWASVHRDGFNAEFNCMPQGCRETMAGTMIRAMRHAQKLLPAGYKFVSNPSIKVDLADIAKDVPADCMVAGCDKSWNAYTQKLSGVEMDMMTYDRRPAGGHLHISEYDSIKGNPNAPTTQWIFDKEQVLLYIKMLDYWLGLPMTVWHSSPEMFLRRQYYGKAGEFRFQKYPSNTGVEYRVLGPEVWNNPMVYSFAAGVMRQVAYSFNEFKKVWDVGKEPDIRHAINTGEGAERLLCLLPNKTFYTQAQLDKTIKEVRPYRNLSIVANYAGAHGWDYYHRRVAV